MFGGGHNDAQTADPAAAPQSDGTLNGISDLTGDAVATPVSPPPAFDAQAGFLPAPAEPSTEPAATEDTPAPAVVEPTEPIEQPEPDTAATSVPAVPATSSDDLLDIKQQALQQLTPLVGHLDQTPEEKFRTTMMLIQASDNQALLKEAYEAAQAITDEKTRAQALLDVINEINYFTQKPQEPAA
jgi:hypothetical protein